MVYVINTVKGTGIVNKAEVDAFLEFSCFFNYPTDVGNLITGSSAFSKSSLNIWDFSVHILLKPGLEKFEHYFANVWDECNCEVVWTFFGIAFLWEYTIEKRCKQFMSLNRWMLKKMWYIYMIGYYLAKKKWMKF